MAAPGLLIAAPASGSGKTTITLALLRHLRDLGCAVSSVKIGPDFIDPAFHTAASGRPCLNIDGWAMRPATIAALVVQAGAGADLLLGEGVMGLFDGAATDQAEGTGSTADMAALTGWPVVLVMDVRGQAASAAATLSGFARHRDDVPIAGVIFNRVGAGRHRQILEEACAGLGIPILGFVPRDAELSLPDRHLGLVQASEHSDLEAFLAMAADRVAAHIDIATLRALARPGRIETADPGGMVPPLGQRIALADDTAFAFAYPAMIARWRHAGAEIVPFSPLADAAPDAAADAVFLPGGYPELHAGRLAASSQFLDGLRDAGARGAVVYGECGGYIVLGRGLEDAEGNRHRMAEMLPLECSFAKPRLSLGYRAVTTCGAGPLGPVGQRYRGHEFHYATAVEEADGDPLFDGCDAIGAGLGPLGRRHRMVMGSFVHLVDQSA